MRTNLLTGIILFVFVVISSNVIADKRLDNFLKQVTDNIKKEQGLSVEKISKELTVGDIVKGLKEALVVGTDNTVKSTSKKDGYFKHPKIKIPLPDQVKQMEKTLRGFGYGDDLDDFLESLNRAAEHAAPKAKDVFVDAIMQMTFHDAKKILDGPDDAATTYFRGKTESRLRGLFKPIASRAMDAVGVTKQYKKLNKQMKKNPFMKQFSFDLDEYVTQKALDGLFYVLAEEEKKIRVDPKARVTDILKLVFK